MQRKPVSHVAPSRVSCYIVSGPTDSGWWRRHWLPGRPNTSRRIQLPWRELLVVWQVAQGKSRTCTTIAIATHGGSVAWDTVQIRVACSCVWPTPRVPRGATDGLRRLGSIANGPNGSWSIRAGANGASTHPCPSSLCSDVTSRCGRYHTKHSSFCSRWTVCYVRQWMKCMPAFPRTAW